MRRFARWVRERPRWRLELPFLLGVVLGAALLVGSGFEALRESRTHSNDWSGIWAGSNALTEGHDPYDPSTWPQVALRHQDQVPETAVYGYPGYVALLLLPLGVLPLGIAATVWTFGGLALAGLGLRALLQAYAPDWPLLHTLIGLCLLVSQPAITTFYDGQWSFLLVGVLSFALVQLAGADRGEAGVLLALACLVKPQLTLLALPGAARALIARGRLRVLAAAATTVLGAVAVSLALLPDWVPAYVGVLSTRLPIAPRATTLPTSLHDLFGTPGFGLGLLIVAALMTLPLLFPARSAASLALALGAGIAGALYSWSYDQLVLLVPLVLACGALRQSYPRRARLLLYVGVACLIGLGLVLHAVFAPTRVNESYNGLVSGVLASAMAIALWPLRRERAAAGRTGTWVR